MDQYTEGRAFRRDQPFHRIIFLRPLSKPNQFVGDDVLVKNKARDVDSYEFAVQEFNNPSIQVIMAFQQWLVVLLLSSLSQYQVVLAQITNQVDFSDGFNCNADGIQLNGNRPFPDMISNGVNDKCTLQLTSDKAEPRAVSAFSVLEFDESNFYFQSRFRYRIFGSTTGSADGIAFVVHQDVRAQSALGDSGGKMGVYGANIIKPALVIEFDTCKLHVLLLVTPWLAHY